MKRLLYALYWLRNHDEGVRSYDDWKNHVWSDSPHGDCRDCGERICGGCE